jgi:hypothetical protein
MEKRIPNLNTFSAIIDRLIVEVNKVAFLENKKREEQQKTAPDISKIAEWDNSSRDANECRSALKNELDKLFIESFKNGYDIINESRTF